MVAPGVECGFDSDFPTVFEVARSPTKSMFGVADSQNARSGAGDREYFQTDCSFTLYFVGVYVRSA